MAMPSSPLKPESWLVAAGREAVAGQPLNVPIIPASNFLHGASRVYSRNDGTAAWEALEEVVGGLESGRCVAFASGMAAAAAILDQLRTGSLLALAEDCYQGVSGLAMDGAGKGRWSVRRVPVEDTGAWVRTCAEADLIWLESPSNPLLTVAELDVICRAPRKPGAILVVDNTFATALNQRPLDLGASVSLQSGTKFIGGHSDLLSGLVTTRDETLWQGLKKARVLAGATPGALEAFLALRGARTLALRYARAQDNAMALAQWLEAHPAVSKVRYPGLPSHPTHAAARRLMAGFGTMISFDVRGDAEAADSVCRNLRLVRHATSLGAVESTLERRAGIPGQEHLPASLLRFSVGIEDLDDLKADLDAALLSV